MFLNYINNFRGIAILIIVAYHCIPFDKVDNGEFTWEMVDALLVNCTILFIFISGFLFQHLIAKFKFFPYLKKRFSFMILPYIIVSIPAIALYVSKYWTEGPFVITEGFYDKPIIEQVFLFYVTGSHLGQLWFIPMIVLFYLVTPLFKFIDSNPRLYWIIPILTFIAIYVGRPIANSNAFQSMVYYVPVYLLGMFASHYKDLFFKYLQKYIYLIWIIFLLFTYLVIFGSFSDISYFQKVVLSLLLLFYLFKYDNIIGTRLDIVAKYSFGIYFIHSYILLMLFFLINKLDLYNFVYGSVISFPLLVGFTSVACMLAIYFSNKVFKTRSRYIIGS